LDGKNIFALKWNYQGQFANFRVYIHFMIFQSGVDSQDFFIFEFQGQQNFLFLAIF